MALIAVLAAAPRGVTRLRAQITNTTGDQVTPIPGAGHDYIHLLSETVNPADGSVSLRIVVPTPKGRGDLAIPAGWSYDSNGVHHMTSNGNGGAMWISDAGYLSSGGWADLAPVLSGYEYSVEATDAYENDYSCEVTTNFLFVDPQGGRHAMGLAGATPSYPDCSYVEPYPPDSYSTGGEGPLRAQCGSPDDGCTSFSSVLITDADGTKYQFSGIGFLHGLCCGAGYSGLPQKIVDRNGNMETFHDTSGGSFSVTDTSGRTAIAYSGFGSSGNTLNVAGQGTFTVYWGSVHGSFTLAAVQLGSYPYCAPPMAYSGSQPVITQITLPNGQAYHLYYESTYGLLSKIVYPSGAYVR